jgi:hypothetical protein
MVEYAGGIDSSPLYQQLVNDVRPTANAPGRGVAVSHKGAIPPARSDAPLAGALLFAPTSNVPPQQYATALDQASPRFSAAAGALGPNAAGGARGTAATAVANAFVSVSVAVSAEREMAQAENVALLFTFQALTDYFRNRERAIDANAGAAKALAKNFRDAAANIADHALTAFGEGMGEAVMTAGAAYYSFQASGSSDVGENTPPPPPPNVAAAPAAPADPEADGVTITDNNDIDGVNTTGDGDGDAKITDGDDAQTAQAAGGANTDGEPTADNDAAPKAETPGDKAADDARADKVADKADADRAAAGDKNKADAKTDQAAGDKNKADAKKADAKRAVSARNAGYLSAGAKAAGVAAGRETGKGQADQNIAQASGAEITALADAAKGAESQAEQGLSLLQKQLDGIAGLINDLKKNHADLLRATYA